MDGAEEMLAVKMKKKMTQVGQPKRKPLLSTEHTINKCNVFCRTISFCRLLNFKILTS